MLERVTWTQVAAMGLMLAAGVLVAVLVPGLRDLAAALIGAAVPTGAGALRKDR